MASSSSSDFIVAPPARKRNLFDAVAVEAPSRVEPAPKLQRSDDGKSFFNIFSKAIKALSPKRVAEAIAASPKKATQAIKNAVRPKGASSMAIGLGDLLDLNVADLDKILAAGRASKGIDTNLSYCLF